MKAKNQIHLLLISVLNVHVLAELLTKETNVLYLGLD